MLGSRAAERAAARNAEREAEPASARLVFRRPSYHLSSFLVLSIFNRQYKVVVRFPLSNMAMNRYADYRCES